MRNHYKTIVVSDVHLGTKGSKVKELIRFLKNNSAENLFLNGDIIDGWQLKKSGSWKKKHTRFFKHLLKTSENSNCKIVYTRGNHDDFLDQIIPFEVGNFSIVRDYTYESFGKKYYIVHGDIFDSVTTNLKWISKLGDIGYTFLLWINGIYNNYRAKKGLPYYSLSQYIKSKVKTAVNFISDFEGELSSLAKSKDCEGIICGHIHQSSLKEINGIKYMNSGDWVESMTALVETLSGEWKIINYLDWAKEEKLNSDLEQPIKSSKGNKHILFDIEKVA